MFVSLLSMYIRLITTTTGWVDASRAGIIKKITSLSLRLLGKTTLKRSLVARKVVNHRRYPGEYCEKGIITAALHRSSYPNHLNRENGNQETLEKSLRCLP